MNQVVVAYGSNIDPERNVTRALEELDRRYGLAAGSDTVQTRPVGRTDQPDFLNGAVLIETETCEDELKRELRDLEMRLGRVRDPDDRNAPRTIDLDIVVWNGRVVDEDVHRRDFLRDAVLQVWPGLASA